MSPLEKDLVPGEPWRFDAEVAEYFSEMLERSIPTYHAMRDLVLRVADPFLDSFSQVLDLGCSTGDTIADVIMVHPHVSVWGVEVSDAMLEVARARFAANEHVHIEKMDLREDFPPQQFDVIFAVLTIQFVPIEHRHRLFATIRDHLGVAGAFVLVEKTLGATGYGHRLMTETYRRAKLDAGYTDEEVRRKALSLEGVLTPLPEATTLSMLADAGFRSVEPFWRWGPFAGWVCLP